MRYVTNSLTLLLSFIGIFVEEQTISDYRIQIIGALILSYFAITFFRRRYKKEKENFSSGVDIFIVNTVVLLLVIATGNIYSPIFFLIYFLCFGITFIFEPITVFIFAVGAVLIFLPEALKNYAFESFVKLGSIFLIAPLAFFFGKEYKDRTKQEIKKEQAKQEAKIASKDIQTVLKNEPTITPEAKAKLSDAVKRTKNLEK